MMPVRPNSIPARKPGKPARRRVAPAEGRVPAAERPPARAEGGTGLRGAPDGNAAPLHTDVSTGEILAQAVVQIGRLCDLIEKGALIGRSHADATGQAAAGRALLTELPVDRAAGQPLAAFQSGVDDLTLAERQDAVNAARSLLEGLYVHLPLKRAMHAIEPLQRLKLLKKRLGRMSVRAFHGEMLRIFISLRDLHTNYVLPASYAGQFAVLPFLVEEYFEPANPANTAQDPVERRRYIVTRVRPDAQKDGFAPGVMITHWNGIPIERAVEINAD